MPKPVFKPAPGTVSKTFVGLDVSLNKTGAVCIALGESDKRHRLSSYAMRQSSLLKIEKLEGAERLEKFEHMVKSFLELHKPELVAIEGYAHGARFQAHALGEAGGIARLTLWKLGIPFVEVQPTTLKLFLTGNGGKTTTKKVIRKAIFSKWGRDFKDDNEADAFGLSLIAGCVSAQSPHELSAGEFEMVCKLRNTLGNGVNTRSNFPLLGNSCQ